MTRAEDGWAGTTQYHSLQAAPPAHSSVSLFLFLFPDFQLRASILMKEKYLHRAETALVNATKENMTTGILRESKGMTGASNPSWGLPEIVHWASDFGQREGGCGEAPGERHKALHSCLNANPNVMVHSLPSLFPRTCGSDPAQPHTGRGTFTANFDKLRDLSLMPLLCGSWGRAKHHHQAGR